MRIGGGLSIGEVVARRFGRIVRALKDDFNNSSYFQPATGAAASGAFHAAPSALAGYTFTASGLCYEVNSDGTIAGPFANNEPAITNEGFKPRALLTNLVFPSAIGSGLADPAGGTDASSVTTNQQATFTATLNAVYTIAAICKADTSGWLRLSVMESAVPSNSADVWYNLATGAVGTSSVGGVGFTLISTPVIIPLTGGFYRCIFWVQPTAATGLLLDLRPVAADASAVVSGSIIQWNRQVIQAGHPSDIPIIPTTTAAATRGASLMTHNFAADASALVDQNMLIWAKVKLYQIVASQYVLDIGSDVNNRIAMLVTNGGVRGGTIVAGVATYSQEVPGAVAAGTEFYMIFRRVAGVVDIGKYVGGVLSWAAAAAVAIPAANKVAVGNHLGGGAPALGTIDSAFIDYGTFDTDAKVIAALTGAP